MCLLTVLSVCLKALPFTNDILRCLQAHCLHFAFFQVLLFKNQSPANDQPQETVERVILPLLPPSLFLSPSFSSIPLFSLPERSLSLLVPPPTSYLPSTTTPPSLAGESGLRMPDVLQSEPRQCKHSALPWEQGGLPSLLPFTPLPSPPILPSSPFLSSLPHRADCQRGGESTKQKRERVCVYLGGGGIERGKKQEYSSSSVFVFWLQ